MNMYDLHLHSTASDGDLAPADVVREAATRGLTGVSLTDHNGLWGIDEARVAASRFDLAFLEGIEVSAFHNGIDVHLLGYSRHFDREVLISGLAKTRRGYRERTQKMVELAQAADYPRISFERIEQRRSQQVDPSFTSFDVARELMDAHGLSVDEARRLTVSGGICHVPYGDWVLTPLEAINLIHRARGVAVLAHPGFIEQEHGRDALETLINQTGRAGLDGLEEIYPYHSGDLGMWLSLLSAEHGWLVTGGSDWHGPGRFAESDKQFGQIGIDHDEYAVLLERLP